MADEAGSERLLYDYGPEGMGSTVSALGYRGWPPGSSGHCVTEAPEASLSETVWDVVPTATSELVRKIEYAWKDSRSD